MGDNKALSKRELVKMVGEEIDLPNTQIEEVLKKILEAIETAWSKGKHIHWRGFGSFDVIERQAYWTKMPWEKKRRRIKKKKTVYFKPSKKMLSRLNKG